MLQALTLNHSSLCCLRNFSSSDPEYFDRNRAMSSRLGYFLGIFLVGVIMFFTRFFAEKMFFFLLSSMQCVENTLTFTCFALVMIYRISFAMTCYHFIMMIISFINHPYVNFVGDFCWMLKAFTAAGFFFIACVMPNQAFRVWGFICLIVSLIMLPLTMNLLLDGLRYVGYHDPLRASKSFPAGASYAIGGLAILAGLTLFIFTFIWEHDHLRCDAYIATTVVLVVLSFLVMVAMVVVGVTRKMASNLMAGGVFFFMVAIGAWAITGAMPFSPCKTFLNVVIPYEKANSGLEIIFNLFFLIPGFYFLGTADRTEYLSYAMGNFSLLSPLYSILLINLTTPPSGIYPNDLQSNLVGPVKRANVWFPLASRPFSQILFYVVAFGYCFYLGTLCASWISPLLHDFTAFDIINHDLIWFRFSALVLGCVIAIGTAVGAFLSKGSFAR